MACEVRKKGIIKTESGIGSMCDKDKTRDQLLAELQSLRKKVELSDNSLSEPESANIGRTNANKKYHELVKNAPVAIFVVQDGKIKFPNPETERFYGLSSAELMAIPMLDFIYEKDRKQAAENYFKNGGFQPGSHILRISGATEAFKWSELKAIPFLWDGKPASLCYQTDISKQKQNEENLQIYQEHLEEITKLRTAELLETLKKAERANEIKDSFLANISHEFYTPIHQINSFSGFGLNKLKKAIETGDAVPEKKLLQYFESVNIASQSLFDFISSLFDLGRLETGEIGFTFIKRNITEAIKMAQYEWAEACLEKELVFEIIEPDIPSEVDFDQQWFGQTLKYIFSNAVKFSPPGGRITISFKQNELIQFGLSQEGIQINISDQGVGIPENELDFIFEKFTQSSRTEDGSGGRGIGLAICWQIVTAHLGEIQATNNQDSGATISITLPYQQPVIDSKIKVQGGFDNL